MEGSPQPAPKRTTLTDLPAARPPERKPTLSGLPAPPPLPLEHSPTVKAPALPFRKTMRVDSPPGLLAAARRSDPPLPAELPPTSVRVPADETGPGSLRDGQEAVLRKALADEREKTRAAEARAQELERQARLAAETHSPNTFPPAVEERELPQAAASAKESQRPGAIRLEGRGWKITLPHVALVAVLTTVGGWFGSKAVSKGEGAEISDVLTELRSVHKDVTNLKGDVADVREEQRKARGDKGKILNYTEDSLTPIVASLRRLGVKLDYDGKSDPARDVEFHPPPLGGSAPPIQPKVTLPERPSL